MSRRRVTPTPLGSLGWRGTATRARKLVGTNRTSGKNGGNGWAPKGTIPGRSWVVGEAPKDMDLLLATKMSRSLKAVSDVNRIRILGILVTGEHCVSDLVERLAIDQPKVSHHLAILRGAGIIHSRRQGRHINYSIRASVHKRVETGQGVMDVFDLGELSISFRFYESGEGHASMELGASSPG